MLKLKKKEGHEEKAARLGKYFVNQHKEAIIKKVERLTEKSRKDLKYITAGISFSWYEGLSTIVEIYNCVIYEHELCSFEDRLDDMMEPPHPDLMKALYMKVEDKQISTAVRFFDPIQGSFNLIFYLIYNIII